MNKKVFIILILLSSFVSTCIYGQTSETDVQKIIADIFDSYTSETEEEIDYQTFYDELLQCAQHPIALNTATREDLERLQVLNDLQVENLLEYLYVNNGMESVFELQLIDGFDMTDIRRILPFVTLGQWKADEKLYFKELINKGKNEFYFQLERGLEPKSGYQSKFFAETENQDSIQAPPYIGNAFYASVRYRFSFKDRVFVGLTAEKDAGEAFMNMHHKGFDFYSMYFQLNKFKLFHTILVGDYRVNFGMGLVVHNAFSIGKSASVLNILPKNTGIRRNTSTNESDYFRGAATTITFKKYLLSVFVSNKFIDADTMQAHFRTWLKTGFHRTEAELSNKNTVNQQVFGANFSANFSNARFAITALHSKLNSFYSPTIQPYNQFYFRGKEQNSASINYQFRYHKMSMIGETALMNNFSTASINALSIQPVAQIGLVLIHRYYSKSYDTFFANTFSEGSRVNNESGTYLGLQIIPFSKWKFSIYADTYQFPWLKYSVDAPSYGEDYLCQAEYNLQRDLMMYLRIRYQESANNHCASTNPINQLETFQKASARYQLSYSVGNFSLKNVIELKASKFVSTAFSYAFQAYQDVSYSFKSIPLAVDGRIQFFDVPNYDNRFYNYEKDILYAFSFPSVYGQGSRYYIVLRGDVTKHISFWFKFSQTVFSDDRAQIGTGNELISGNRKSNLSCLIKYQF